jgi:hypothetical protein
MRTILAGLAIFFVASCSSSSSDAPDQQWALVQNHIYIDHLPKNERDMVKHIAFVDHEEYGKFGVRGQGSRFRFFNDVLKWQRNGNRIVSKVLQTGDDVKATFRAWKCKGDAPRPLDLCLELKEGDRTMRFYSNHEWIIESAADVDHALTTLPLDNN